MRSIQRASRGWLVCGLAGAAFLLGNAISEAQTRSTTGSGSTLTGRNSSTISGQGSSGIGNQGSASQGTNFGQTPSLGANTTTGFMGNQLQQSFKLRSNTNSNVGVGGPIGQYYNNPMALGLPSNSRGGFATPLYSNTGGGTTGGFGATTGGTTGGFGGGGTGSFGGGGSTGGTGGARTTGGVGSTGSFGGGSTGSFGGGSTGSFGGGTGGTRGTGATGGGGFGGGGLGGGLGGGQSATLGGGRTGQGGIGGGLTGGGLTGGLGNAFGSAGSGIGNRTGMLSGMTSATGSGRRSAPYGVNLPPPAPRSSVVTNNFTTELRGVLARSSSLRSAPGIQVGTNGPVVVLRGKVANEYERDLAEAILRLTPGVRDISNELEVEEVPLPRPVP